MRWMTTRRAVLALLLVMTLAATLACREPLVPVLRFCGVDTLQVPVTIGDTTYTESLIQPRRCDDAVPYTQ